MFDSSIGAGTVLMPYGGRNRLTPPDGMVAKLPLLKGETTTCSIMAFGFQPDIFKWSPFHGGAFAIVESVAKMVALGANPKAIRLSLQEYFERLGNDPQKWGKPFAALLGAFQAQKQLGLAAIGGKDSMSGSFEDLHVPPTLVSFAVAPGHVDHILSPEFKGEDHLVYTLPMKRTQDQLPDWDVMTTTFDIVHLLVQEQLLLSAKAVDMNGLAHALAVMSFGNGIGLKLEEGVLAQDLLGFQVGGLIVEVDPRNKERFEEVVKSLDVHLLGLTTKAHRIVYQGETVEGKDALMIWKQPLAEIYPEGGTNVEDKHQSLWTIGNGHVPILKTARPKVFVPVFPGTNCEFDTIRAFERAGASVETVVFRNQTSQAVDQSIEEMAKAMASAQMFMFPGGFSAGDEPEGSAKFIAAVFRHNRLKDEVADLLENRDGLILGICNGFQALIKLGLLPDGKIREILPTDPTLTFNHIGRHISSMANTVITSNLSPWLNKTRVGDVFAIPISHGEGRFAASESVLETLADQGQIAIRYQDINPNGSDWAVEAISSPDGRILGKMGHSERVGNGLYKNIPGTFDQKIFEAGVSYFR
jgi:phosphoribosylformylglycinamidine synthase